MENWIQKAIAQWKAEGIELNQGTSLAEIAIAEKRMDIQFPNDFKELYTTVNGFVDFEITGFFLSLWSLDRIINDYNLKKDYIMFSDHSLSVCQYGFKRNNVGIFKAYTHHQQGPISRITESFKEIIELINSDSELLF